MPDDSYFLGLDSSTQSLTAILIDPRARRVVFEHTLNFDADLPQYGTRNGVLPNSDPRVAHAPPAMWAEALDQLFTRMKKAGVPLAQVAAVTGSGQQHGSVYLKPGVDKALRCLAPDRPLAEQITPWFSRPTSPIWMDSSATAECAEITKLLGHKPGIVKVTGSAACARFTGPQIRHFYKTDPAGYERTAHIALVSSFMASLLAGKIAAIDHGDGAGMNLMDIRLKKWHGAALDATAPDLARRLPALAPSWQVGGKVSPFWVQRYGLNSEALAMVWSGDNPNSLMGLGLMESGNVAISLGTSDTCFCVMNKCRTDPRGEGHAFVSPTGDYMALICFQNGSLAREKIRSTFRLDWPGFSHALRHTPPGNDGKMMLPWFAPEIVPKVLQAGVRRFGLDEQDAEGNCRAVVEAQMLSMRLHSEWMGIQPSRIHATGGASANPEIIKIMADIQQCPVYRFQVTNSAALGAALRAWHGAALHAGTPVAWKDIAAGFADPISGSCISPDPGLALLYRDMLKKYADFEKKALGTLE